MVWFFLSYDKWAGLCISDHFYQLVVTNELLAYALTNFSNFN